MSLQEYQIALNEVTKNLLDKAKLEKFVHTYGVKGIVGAGFLATKDKEIHKQSELAIRQWIKDDKIYNLFLFSTDKNDQEVLKQLMLHPQSSKREIAAECIDLHAYEIGDALKGSKEDPLYHTYIQALTYLLSDSETEVALKILRALKKMLRVKSGQEVMTDNLWINEVKNGIENKDEVVALRFMELVVSMSNSNEELHEKLHGTKVLERAISLYSTDDILVKLNAAEIFGQFGEQEYNTKYLAECGISKQIIQEAFNPKEDLYVRKSAVLLVVKMISGGAMKLTDQLQKDILSFVRQLLLSSSQEEISSSFQIISFLSLKQQGLDLLLKDQKLIKSFLDYSTSTRTELRKQCIIALTHATATSQTNPKNKNQVVNLVSCIGNPAFASSIGDFKQDTEGQEKLEGWIKQLDLNIFSPFEDIEIEYMFFLKNCLDYELLLDSFVKWGRSVEYIASRYCKNKLIFDLKQELNEKVLFLVGKKANQNQIYKNFLSNLEIQKTQKQGKNEEMSYETSSK